ncbi:hypothetical protein D3C72_1106260 [compost metagenome]
MAVFGVVGDVTAQGLLQRAEEVPVRVGAVAGAHQRNRDLRVGEQCVTGFTFGLDRASGALLQVVRGWQQVAEQRVQWKEVGQVALVWRGAAGFGDERLRVAVEQALTADRFGQCLRRHFGAHRRPVGVGAQEHLAAGLGLLHGGHQVRGEHVGLACLGMELVVQVVMQAGRQFLAQVLGIHPRLGWHDRQYKLAAVLLQGVTHATDQRQVFLHQLLGTGGGLELFVTEQPLVAAQHHAGTAFVEQLEVHRRPKVGAQALDRELLVVVGLGGLGQLAVEQGHLLGTLEALQATGGPDAHAHQQAEERQRIGNA